MAKITLVDDDENIVASVSLALESHGHTVKAYFDGASGLAAVESDPPDLVILDVKMPRMDGMEVLRRLRAGGDATPALVLSSLGDVEHRVEGLREGADDYLAKPFSFVELLARLEGLQRRARPGAPGPATVLEVADLRMDLLKRTVHRGGQAVDLQPREFRLLEYLMRNAERVVSRTMLLEAVWDYHFDPQTNVIDVHVSRLRQKIDKGHAQPLLHTVRGAGYLLGTRA